MAFHLRARPPAPQRSENEARSRVDASVRAADWAEAALSLSIAQAGYRAALESGAGSAALGEATTALMRARTRLEALRRAAAPGEMLAAG